MASTSEYEQQQFWNESYERTVIKLLTDKFKEEYEEWFRYTHGLIMKHITIIKDGE